MTNEGFDEDALQRALNAPGTPAELAGEAAFRTMFREARASAPVLAAVGAHGVRRRTTARRLGATTALAAAFAVATAGVAAAYSTNLPAPVQRVVHSVLAPIGVPAAEPEPAVDPVEEQPAPEPAPAGPDPAPPVPGPGKPSEQPSQTPSAEPSPSATPSEEPSVDPTGSASPTEPASPTESPTSVPSSGEPSPSESPSPSAPSPSASASAPEPTTPPAPTPAEVDIVSAGAGNKVAPGGTAVVTGRVGASDGAAVPHRKVVLQQRTDSGWQRIGVGRTSSDGSVSLATPPAKRTMTVRLRAGKVKSTPLRLVVQSSVTASAQTVDQTSTVTASVTGGQPGDLVLLLTRRDGVLVQEGRGALDAAGNVEFTFPAPLQQRSYVVRLPATESHGAAQVKVLVAAAVAAPLDES